MNGLTHTVASVGQATRLGRGAKRRPHEINRGPDRLRPECNRSRRMVDLRMVGDKAMLLDKVAGEFDETVGIAVAVKDRSEHRPPIAIGVRGRAARPVLYAKLRHAAPQQAP